MKHCHRVTRRRRPKYRFTKEDCRRGYQAALRKCMEDWDLYAWFYHVIHRYYTRKERDLCHDDERNEKRR